MTQSFQIGDIVRTKKTGKRCVITRVYRSRDGNIIHEGYEYDALDIPPGTTRSDLPYAFAPDISTYAEHLILDVPSPWRRIRVGGRPIPMVGELFVNSNGEVSPETVDRVIWLFGIIDVNGRVFTTGTVPSPAFTTF